MPLPAPVMTAALPARRISRCAARDRTLVFE
jgi:hypothetical protein